jgi:dephospho-CoA kinase
MVAGICLRHIVVLNGNIKMSKLFRVLVTGSIGAGKTTACKMFGELGVPVFYSDLAAKKIMDSNKEVINKVKLNFEGVYEGDVLNRKKLADIVFNDEDKLELLNSIVHPVVGEAFEDFVKVNEETFKDSQYVIEEAAIAIELGIQDKFDYIVVVTAKEPIRIERVMARDNCTKEQVVARINNQVSEEERCNHADTIISNNDIKKLKGQVKAANKIILKNIKSL